MNIIYFFLGCLLLIPISALAEFTNEDLCKEYASINDNAGEYPYLSDEIIQQKGFLWKVEQNGIVNYLFGSIHSQDYRITRIPPQVRLAIVKSEIVLLEVVPDRTGDEIFLNAIYADEPYTLKEIIHPSVYQRIENRIADYDISTEKVSRLKPWAVFTIMGRPAPVKAPTLEMILYQLALSTNRKVVGIESMQELVTVLDDLSLEDQIEIVNDTICNIDQIILDTAELINLYLSGDLEGIINFNNKPHHDEAVYNRFINKILIERNAKMLERILPYLDKGNIFIAVGVMHLAGKTGLLERLKAMGYSLEKIY